MIEKIKQFLNIQNKVEMTVFEKIENRFSELGGDIITLKFGDDLLNYADMLQNIIDNIRSDLSNNIGFILPAVHMLNDKGLQENEYVIELLDKTVLNEFIVPNIEGIEEIYDKLKSIILENVNDIFTNELTEKYIDTVQKNNGWLIWSLSCKLSPVDIKLILTDIINSGHSIKNINRIFEKIGNKVLIDNKYNNINPHYISKEIISEL